MGLSGTFLQHILRSQNSFVFKCKCDISSYFLTTPKTYNDTYKYIIKTLLFRSKQCCSIQEHHRKGLMHPSQRASSNNFKAPTNAIYWYSCILYTNIHQSVTVVLMLCQSCYLCNCVLWYTQLPKFVSDFFFAF